MNGKLNQIWYFPLAVDLSKVETSEVKIKESVEDMKKSKQKKICEKMSNEKEAVTLLRDLRLFYNICHGFVTAHKICHIHVVYLI